MSASIPTAVLSPALADAIAGRRVRAALFTTFTFDPGFFEQHVLPLLFDQSFSQIEKVRLAQLEDTLRTVESLAVYYDRSALSQDAEPARLDYRRIDVRRQNGAFHPKIALVLVGEVDEEGARHETLVVAALSANLTRAGWWENIESAHVEEIPAAVDGAERCSYRRDLMALLLRIRRCAPPDEDHGALETIHTFLVRSAPQRSYERASAGGCVYTRLFGGRGKMGLAAWIESLGLDRGQWNLEVISPFFDPTGAGPLEDLITVIGPRRTRVYLPLEADGTALVTEATYDAVEALGAQWAKLPSELVDRGRGAEGERLAPRRLHAKVYRLWSQRPRQVVIVGSVNLTRAAHSPAGTQNLEAAFLVDASHEPKRWWLTPCDDERPAFVEKAPEEDTGLESVPIDLSLRFDWATGTLHYRLHEKAAQAIELTDLTGGRLFTIDRPRAGPWVQCSQEAAEVTRAHLASSSFIRAVHLDGEWRILIREEGMAHRPSILQDLTAEEILEYWSLLTAEQRAAFIERRVALDLDIEGLPAATRDGLGAGNTLFDRFAGIYHAFGCLERHVIEAVDKERWHDADALLFGAKYDSLPLLLERTLAADSGDPVTGYVTFLAAKQMVERIRRDRREFWRAQRAGAGRLQSALEHLSTIQAALGLDDEHGRNFLDWFEPAFLRDLSHKIPSDEDDHA